MNIKPPLIYGTAWKGEKTTQLVEAAVMSGFRAIDTANQPKHYSESLVGEALFKLAKQGISREQLFLQTKFTSVEGQDTRIPYDPNDDYETQVAVSFQSSLEHLKTDYVDCYLLHGPSAWPGLCEADWHVWSAIEKIYIDEKAKLIGVNNVNISQLNLFMQHAKIKPMVVQNRCYASHGWDKEIREFCKKQQIMYQGFSLLTANPEVLLSKKVQEIALRLQKTPAQIIFQFALQVGMIPLTGTTDKMHMHLDLEINSFQLTEAEVANLERG